MAPGRNSWRWAARPAPVKPRWALGEMLAMLVIVLCIVLVIGCYADLIHIARGGGNVLFP